MSDCPFASEIGRRLHESRHAITARWLDRIAARVTVPAPEIFPTDELLDHMPLLIDSIAGFVQHASEVIPADSVVVHHARELGELRYRQGFNEHEVLKEFEILGAIIFTFVGQATREIASEADHEAIVETSSRIFHAVALVQQSTTGRFLELANARIAEREARLRAFQRALTHELRNRIGATLGAGQLLQTLHLSDAQRVDLTAVVVRNADSMRLVLQNLLELTRLESDTRHQRHVHIAAAIQEAARELREMAESRDVRVQIASDWPPVEVNAAVVELCFMNLIANAIKYSDSAKADRWVSLSPAAGDTADESEIVIEIRDNGIGIPAEHVDRIFERFYRAHSESEPAIEGTGLGLNLVRETLATIGGRIWVESSAVGTSFYVGLPCRRDAESILHPSDEAALGRGVSS
jgi:signal transduction histidine kinase